MSAPVEAGSGLLSVKETCARLNLSRSAFYDRLKDGSL